MQGSLTPSYGLADVVRGIYVGRRSGILALEHGSERKQLYFEKGSFVFSDTNDPAWRFGALLVRRGKIAEADLERVVALLGPGRRIGMVLRDLGLLDDHGLAEAVAYQITENVYPAFSWESGEFRFEEKDDPAPSDIAFAMSTANVIMEGVRRIRDVEFIRRALGPTDQVVSLGSNPLLRFQSIFLKPKEGFILSRIEGVVTVDEVAAVSPVPEDDVLRCLYGLRCTGILELRRPGEAEEVPAEEANIAGFFSDYAGVEQFLGARHTTRAEPAEPSAEEKREQAEIVEFARTLSALDHYAVLGVGKGADAREVRNAYYRLAKKYHPDRHHKSHLAGLQEKLEAIFVRVNEAYETLKDDKLRSRYDRRTAPQPGPAQAAAGGDAGAGQRAGPGADAARRQPAEASWREGRQLLERGDIFGAIRSFQFAVQAQPDRAAFRASLGRALARNPKWRKDAEEHLLKAIELEPAEGEHYAQLGLLYEGAGLASKAERYFEEALRRDPANATALGARAKRADEGRPGGRSGTFRGLFDKKR